MNIIKFIRSIFYKGRYMKCSLCGRVLVKGESFWGFESNYAHVGCMEDIKRLGLLYK